jgi:ammonium transporter, Amt family
VTSSSAVDASTLTVCALLIVLVPFAPAGLALINTGFGRARGAAYAMLSSLTATAIAAVVYCFFGFSWEGFPGRPANLILLGGKPWDWISRGPFLLRGLAFNDSPATLAMLLQVFTVSLAALIPVSTGADRWRLRSLGISTALLAGWTYPLFAHWVWGGGWLAQLGSNFGLGDGFLDAGGAGAVQVLGGLSALSIAWILGPRRGKYLADGGPAAFPGHNIVYVLFGCALIVPGWIGLNAAGSILFAGAAPSRIALIAVNTLLSASASCLTAMAGTRFRFGKPDASLCANGWLGGLVASSAVCCFVTPMVAIFVGLVAGALVTIAVEVLEVHLTVDDPGGAISVHAVAGIWGLLAVGIFPHILAIRGSLPSGVESGSGQLLAQVVGVATLLGLMLPMAYGLNWLLNRIDPQRVAPRGERLGMDMHELGGGAYPEFVVHRED